MGNEITTMFVFSQLAVQERSGVLTVTTPVSVHSRGLPRAAPPSSLALTHRMVSTTGSRSHSSMGFGALMESFRKIRQNKTQSLGVWPRGSVKLGEDS